MGLLRGFGYFIAILILIAGIVLIPLGIPLIIAAIVMMYVLHKGGQMTGMKKDLAALRQIEEDNRRREIQQQTQDALRRNYELKRQQQSNEDLR